MPLTYEARLAFTYPAGAQTLHANFHADETGFYFASSGKVFTFDTDAQRTAANDFTLENLPTTQTVWGFTGLSDGRWAVLTREALQSGDVGVIRTFTSAGRAEHTRRVPPVLQGFISERWRSPKALVQVGDNLYCRVVRISVSQTNQRWLRFDSTGQIQNADLVVDTASPTALSDGASNGQDTLLITQQNERKVYFVSVPGFRVNTADTSDLDSQNTAPWATSATEDTLYVADRGGYIYAYSGIAPAKPPAGGTGGGGLNFNIFTAIQVNGLMSRRLNRRDR